MTYSTPIYLDNHATTPVDPRVAEVVMRYLTVDYGNANSVDHLAGEQASNAIERAEVQIRDLLGTPGYRTVFTSGATESINLALRGFVAFVRARYQRPARIGISAIEHPAVTRTAQVMADAGDAELAIFEVDDQARLDLDLMRARLQIDPGLDLVCVMAANNVVGTRNPVKTIGDLAHRHGALLFVDATQVVGHCPIDDYDSVVDAFAFSGHKMYGPKGIGALVLAPHFPIEPVITGGSQQMGLRAGTLNVPGVAGLGEAAALRFEEMSADEHRISGLRDQLQEELKRRIPNLVVFGDQANRLPGNLSVAFPGIPNKAIIARIRKDLCVATGAACSSGLEQPAAVLRQMAVPDDLARSHIRIGIGKFNTAAEISRAADLLSEAVAEIGRILGRTEGAGSASVR